MRTHGAAVARSQDRAAGMGAGARPADAGLSRGRALGPRPRSGISRRRAASEVLRRPKAPGARSARPSRRPPPPCWRARASSPIGPMAEAGRQQATTRCGFVALIGAPNAGKSTLLNALVGAKVSIVTPKVQTTRALIRGIAIEGAAQLIFVDTPGIFAPRRRLDRAMVGSAWGGTQDADIVALLIDAAQGVQDDDEAILRRARRRPRAQGAGAQQDRPGRQAEAARRWRKRSTSAWPSPRPS